MRSKIYEFDWQTYLKEFPILEDIESAEILKEDEKNMFLFIFGLFK